MLGRNRAIELERAGLKSSSLEQDQMLEMNK